LPWPRDRAHNQVERRSLHRDVQIRHEFPREIEPFGREIGRKLFDERFLVGDGVERFGCFGEPDHVPRGLRFAPPVMGLDVAVGHRDRPPRGGPWRSAQRHRKCGQRGEFLAEPHRQRLDAVADLRADFGEGFRSVLPVAFEIVRFVLQLLLAAGRFGPDRVDFLFEPVLFLRQVLLQLGDFGVDLFRLLLDFPVDQRAELLAAFFGIEIPLSDVGPFELQNVELVENQRQPPAPRADDVRGHFVEIIGGVPQRFEDRVGHDRHVAPFQVPRREIGRGHPVVDAVRFRRRHGPVEDLNRRADDHLVIGIGMRKRHPRQAVAVQVVVREFEDAAVVPQGGPLNAFDRFRPRSAVDGDPAQGAEEVPPLMDEEDGQDVLGRQPDQAGRGRRVERRERDDAGDPGILARRLDDGGDFERQIPRFPGEIFIVRLRIQQNPIPFLNPAAVDQKNVPRVGKGLARLFDQNVLRHAKHGDRTADNPPPGARRRPTGHHGEKIFFQWIQDHRNLAIRRDNKENNREQSRRDVQSGANRLPTRSRGAFRSRQFPN
jgi:hypothetical protein